MNKTLTFYEIHGSNCSVSESDDDYMNGKCENVKLS